MTLKDDLIAARALIDTPEKWGKGVGTYCRSTGPACAHEALRRSKGPGHETLRKYLSAVLPQGFTFTTTFNDDPSTTHADILALFDRAIEAAA